MEGLLPGLKFEYRRHLVDYQIAVPRRWRDLFRYSPDGTLIGWQRREENGTITEFTADGIAVETRDDLGRCATGVRVSYRTRLGPKELPWNQPPQTFTRTGSKVRYEYSGPADFRGAMRDAE
jgi:hypothetical protein